MEYGSFSPQYYHWERTTIINAIKNTPTVTPCKLIEIVDFIREKTKAQNTKYRYIGMASVESGTGELSNEIESASGDAFVFKKGDILYGKLRPYLNKVWLATFDGICSTEFHVLRLKTDIISSEMLTEILLSNIVLKQTVHMMTGNTHPRISDDDVKKLLLPIPKCTDSVKEEINYLLAKKTERNEKIKKAEKQIIENKKGIENRFNLNQSENKLCFAVRFKKIDGVIDVKRYSTIGNVEHKLTISDLCDVVDERVNVSSFGNCIVDWIRIDDLQNQPLDIEQVRTMSATEIDGTFFEVQKDDILVARLGPTILNQKIVMVRNIERTTIASSEFLVLRCKKGYNPEAVMSILKTDYYMNLMYSNARGSTPSRYRLNRSDMLKLPFPDIADVQDEVAENAISARETAKKLRVEAEQEWQAAKAQFEKELLGE